MHVELAIQSLFAALLSRSPAVFASSDVKATDESVRVGAKLDVMRSARCECC